MTVHEFGRSLSTSHRYADAPWWWEVYQQAFGSLAAMADLRGDGVWQRAGIDRVVTLGTSVTYRIDEKVRECDYGDIILERWSDLDRETPGWIQKPLMCDFIAYAIVPTQTCYLLPFPQLRRAWKMHGREWIAAAERRDKGFRIVEAKNLGYVTQSVALPTAVLFAALSEAFTVHCEAITFAPNGSMT